MLRDPLLRLRTNEIENTFNKVVCDLHRILVYDGTDQLEPGFRIQCHDLYGPLPVIEIDDTQDRYSVLDRIERETAKLCAIVGMREDLAAIFRGGKFLLPTRTDKGYMAGLMFGAKTILAAHRTHWEAYHQLTDEAVRRIL